MVMFNELCRNKTEVILILKNSITCGQGRGQGATFVVQGQTDSNKFDGGVRGDKDGGRVQQDHESEIEQPQTGLSNKLVKFSVDPKG